MSSSADFSDEDDYSGRSGCVSPAPGDTLPWNLPRHERSKRKIHGGSILDPAERAVLRIAGKIHSIGAVSPSLPSTHKHTTNVQADYIKGVGLPEATIHRCECACARASGALLLACAMHSQLSSNDR